MQKFYKDDKQRWLISKNSKKKYFKLFNATNVYDFFINKTYNLNKNFIGKKKFTLYLLI